MSCEGCERRSRGGDAAVRRGERARRQNHRTHRDIPCTGDTLHMHTHYVGPGEGGDTREMGDERWTMGSDGGGV